MTCRTASWRSKLDADGRVTGRALVTLAREGDGDALRVFDHFARMLGVAIGGYVNVFEPEYVVIGGGLSRAADLYFERRWTRPARAPCRLCGAA